MLLALIRDYANEYYTGGRLLIDGVAYFNTIEPPIKPNTTHRKGCIPMGWYKVRVTYSQRFKRQMALLYQVPGFEGIRIHAGLHVENTQGCICVGERWKEERLTKILTKAQERNEEIYICITDTDHYSTELPKYANPDEPSVGY